jgi:hypothetical protein
LAWIHNKNAALHIQRCAGNGPEMLKRNFGGKWQKKERFEQIWDSSLIF